MKVKVIYTFRTKKGYPYKVILQKGVTLFGDACYGVCDKPSRKGAFIRLDEEQKKRRMAETVIHEMVHAFFFDESEECADSFAKATVDLLRKLKLLASEKKPRCRSRSRS